MSLAEVPAFPTGLAASLARQEVHPAGTFYWAAPRPSQSGFHRLFLGGKRAEDERFSEEEPKVSLGHLALARCCGAGGAADRIALSCPSRQSLAINPLPGQGADKSGAEVQRRQVLGGTFQPGAPGEASLSSVLPSRWPGWLQAGRRCWPSWCYWVSGGCVAGGKGPPCWLLRSGPPRWFAPALGAGADTAQPAGLCW